MSSARKDHPETVTFANNRRARFDFAIEESIEAGLVLTGVEVKAVRAGRVSISEAYAAGYQQELFLYQAHIEGVATDPASNKINLYAGAHRSRRPRKLLLHRRQINKMLGAIAKQGYTLIPLRLYANAHGLIKMQLALGKGKRQYDKRATIKERQWQRSQGRILRGHSADRE